MAITDLYNRVVKYRDEGYNSCYLFLDLSKAFDTVNHKLLLNKLSQNDIRGKIFDLLSSYLINRKHFTKCNNIKLSYAARIFFIIRHYVNKQTLTKLYYSFAYPHIKYGITVCHGAVLVKLTWKKFK